MNYEILTYVFGVLSILLIIAYTNKSSYFEDYMDVRDEKIDIVKKYNSLINQLDEKNHEIDSLKEDKQCLETELHSHREVLYQSRMDFENLLNKIKDK